jgi:hypothetical protein
MSPVFDLDSYGVGEWKSPDGAAAADAGSVLRLQSMIIAVRIKLQNMLWEAEKPSERRQLERHLDDAHRTGVLIASLLNGMKHQ